MADGLELEGCRLAWQAQGDGVPVLFIHGTAAAIWGDLPARTASFARALTYDRRGFGQSAASPIADLKRHEDDAIALLAAHAGGTALLVGWSVGGIIALGVAARRPDLVRGLLLLEPPLWAKKHPDLNLFNGVVLSILTGFIAGAARGGRRFSSWVFRERDGTSSLDEVSPAIRRQIADNAAAVGVEIRGGTGEHLSAAALAGIAMSAVVVTGDRSQAFFEAGARRVADAVPGARLQRLAAASHFLQLEHAATIAALIQEMVAEGTAERVPAA
ncbi:MAG: alpha/beta fold hydrolase [Reyranellaceae bacterium]